MNANVLSSSPARVKQYRLALLPVSQHIDSKICVKALLDGGSSFLSFLLSQDLGPLWHYHLQSNNLLTLLPSASVEALHRARMAAAVGYLPQRIELERIDRLFSAQSIDYVVIKGGQVRESLYPDPALRPASDVDLLVLPQDRQLAAHVLLNAGYIVHTLPDTISHQAAFSRSVVNIDLHWDILRPGRTRVEMTSGFLTRRQWLNGFWGLSDNDALFLMLTHPAFNKYVCSPNMGLGRVADFLLWIQLKQIDWLAVLSLLEQAGLKTAAWMMLSWFRMLAQPEVAKQMDKWLLGLYPGRIRADYLRYWLTHDLPTRWLHKPLLIQLGLTLFLHDHLTDSLYAVQKLLQVKRNHLRDERLLLGNKYLDIEKH